MHVRPGATALAVIVTPRVRVGMSDGLGTHRVDLPGLRERHRTENLRHEGPKVCDTVGLGPNHDDEEGRTGHRLLPCQVAVRRDEPSESRLLHAREQVSVRDA